MPSTEAKEQTGLPTEVTSEVMAMTETDMGTVTEAKWATTASTQLPTEAQASSAQPATASPTTEKVTPESSTEGRAQPISSTAEGPVSQASQATTQAPTQPPSDTEGTSQAPASAGPTLLPTQPSTAAGAQTQPSTVGPTEETGSRTSATPLDLTTTAEQGVKEQTGQTSPALAAASTEPTGKTLIRLT